MKTSVEFTVRCDYCDKHASAVRPTAAEALAAVMDYARSKGWVPWNNQWICDECWKAIPVADAPKCSATDSAQDYVPLNDRINKLEAEKIELQARLKEVIEGREEYRDKLISLVDRVKKIGQELIDFRYP